MIFFKYELFQCSSQDRGFQGLSSWIQISLPPQFAPQIFPLQDKDDKNIHFTMQL